MKVDQLPYLTCSFLLPDSKVKRSLVFVCADPQRPEFWALLRAGLGLEYASDLAEATRAETGQAADANSLSQLCTELSQGEATLIPVSPREDLQKKALDILPRLSKWYPHTDFILSTSGSSKAGGHLVSLSRSALRASSAATAQFFQARGLAPGQWIIALPLDHIAGLQVAIRSELAGWRACFLDMQQSFTAASLTELINAQAQFNSGTDAPKLYLSLVPTQLYRCLDDPECVKALRQLAVLLLGGAAPSRALLREASQAELPVYTTYGMTETCGGCVYDGVALPGTELRIEQERVLLAPPGLMNGYLEAETAEEAAPFKEVAGKKFLLTNDRGKLTSVSGQETLQILGRLDAVIISGGINIPLNKVQSLAEETFTAQGVKAQVVALGIPDPQWGQALCLAYSLPATKARLLPASGSSVPAAGFIPDPTDGPRGRAVPSAYLPEDWEELLRESFRAQLPREMHPKKYCYFPELPLFENGKINLPQLKELCAKKDS